MKKNILIFILIIFSFLLMFFMKYNNHKNATIVPGMKGIVGNKINIDSKIIQNNNFGKYIKSYINKYSDYKAITNRNILLKNLILDKNEEFLVFEKDTKQILNNLIETYIKGDITKETIVKNITNKISILLIHKLYPNLKYEYTHMLHIYFLWDNMRMNNNFNSIDKSNFKGKNISQIVDFFLKRINNKNLEYIILINGRFLKYIKDNIKNYNIKNIVHHFGIDENMLKNYNDVELYSNAFVNFNYHSNDIIYILEKDFNIYLPQTRVISEKELKYYSNKLKNHKDMIKKLKYISKKYVYLVLLYPRNSKDIIINTQISNLLTLGVYLY